MKRVEGTKGVHLLECINPYKNRWAIRFDLQPSVNELSQNVGVNYIEVIVDHQPFLEEIRAFVENGIEQYDKSEDINQFTINGVTMWLDKSTRISLENDFRREKEKLSKNHITLWNPESPYQSFNLPIDIAISMLSTLGEYAKECYNVTLAHKRALYNIEIIDELLMYNFRNGYPSRVVF